jgi:membrane-associated phospholipid phosphatase
MKQLPEYYFNFKLFLNYGLFRNPAGMAFFKYVKRLNCIDLLVSGYIIVTFFYILIFFQKIPSAGYHILFRMFLLGLILALPRFDKYIRKPIFHFLRIAYPLIILSFFYSETDALNNVFFQNLDHHFARLDSLLFGFQPSLAFYDKFPGKIFSEVMNFGYFSYYFLIAAYFIIIYVKKRQEFIRTVFHITCSFLIYYLIFSVLPVSGPQYFFEPPHNQIADSGIFRKLVRFVEFIGERPTAAFPSSHVGIVLILIMMAWRDSRKTWWWLIPVFVLLAFSTVYIKAHYAVDVLGGIISAPIVLAGSHYIFKILRRYELTIKTRTDYAEGFDC